LSARVTAGDDAVSAQAITHRPLDHCALVGNMGLAFGDVPIGLS
jgi:hypothetical protein